MSTVVVRLRKHARHQACFCAEVVTCDFQTAMEWQCFEELMPLLNTGHRSAEERLKR